MSAMRSGQSDPEDRDDSEREAASVRLVAWDDQDTHDVGRVAAEPAVTGYQPSTRAPAETQRGLAETQPMAAACIGRYSVLREIGRGGMGVTYMAYDEELDRKVAIKLVRSELLGADSQRRLRREAQALARFTHPNIVAVHDVGVHHGQPFIAMEFVRGQTLSAWLAAQPPHAWAEVLSVFCQAGEGLRAAHAAGLVHRDIKPANIMVGDDGRVRVLDFGLARHEMFGDEQVDTSTREALALHGDVQLTQTGMLLGTLVYMAPEHLEYGIADARSDQFAFCVSLFEALYGRQPFQGTTPRERLAVMRRGTLTEVPGKSPVPGWLHGVIVRGLAFAPEQRWPSMDALLVELAREPAQIRRRRRWIAGGLGAGAVALAGALIVGGLVAEDRRAAVCSGAQAQVSEVWGQAQQAAIEQAMLATGVPYARDTWQRTRALLDRYAAEWAAAHTDACEATAVRQEQSEEVLDQRMQCLARRRRSLRALAGELGRIDAASIAQAIQAASRLPLVASCGDPAYLSSRVEPPRDPAVAGQVDSIESALTRAEQLHELGRFDEGLVVAHAAFESAGGAGYPPIEGSARLHLGTLQLATAAYQPAEDNLREAYFIARTTGDHDMALRAATQLVYLLGFHVSRLGDAGEWSRHVQAELPWVSAEEEQASSLNTLGGLAFLQGKHQEAIALCQRALIVWEQVLGPGHPRVTHALGNLGVVLHAQGKYAEATELHRRSLAIIEMALGAEHPSVTYSLNNLAASLYLQGARAEAAGAYRRALAVGEQAVGREHPLLGDLLVGLALTSLDDQRAAEALPLAERALAVLERHEAGPETLSEARFVLARALMGTGQDPQRALALAREARDALRTRSAPRSLIDLAEVEAWLRAHQPRP
jgi:tetratricopeptide (TPR) repeat protein/predicted Ser/Thr protein kinase